LKLLWFSFVQFYLTVGFKFYYKKIDVIYKEKIPKDKAVIFLSNHQNALLDPLLVSISSTRKNYFLTRAAVFKNSTVAKLLNSLQMLPVYRMIDGVNTIQKNRAIFTFCTKLLDQKKSIILFPEGSHSLKRKVRPLKKGAARIIQETLQEFPKREIIIIPVGVNYQAPTEYGDSMSVYFGKHISPTKFWDGSQLDMQELNKTISTELKQLTSHIESISDYEQNLKNLKNLKIDFTSPIAVNKCLQNDFLKTENKIKKPSSLYLFFIFLIKVFYFIPYFIWKKVAFPKITEDEFIGTFRYVLIITLAPIYLLLLVFSSFLFFGKTIGLTLLGIGIILPLVTLRVK
jgi:1-acyl-sn-glycerol-3-phosphate acyltransferase